VAHGKRQPYRQHSWHDGGSREHVTGGRQAAAGVGSKAKGRQHGVAQVPTSANSSLTRCLCIHAPTSSHHLSLPPFLCFPARHYTHCTFHPLPISSRIFGSCALTLHMHFLRLPGSFGLALAWDTPAFHHPTTHTPRIVPSCSFFHLHHNVALDITHHGGMNHIRRQAYMASNALQRISITTVALSADAGCAGRVYINGGAQRRCFQQRRQNKTRSRTPDALRRHHITAREIINGQHNSGRRLGAACAVITHPLEKNEPTA